MCFFFHFELQTCRETPSVGRSPKKVGDTSTALPSSLFGRLANASQSWTITGTLPKGWISIAQSEHGKKIIIKKNQPLATVSHWCDKCARRRGGCSGSTVSDSSQKEKPFPETQRDFLFLFLFFNHQSLTAMHTTAR